MFKKCQWLAQPALATTTLCKRPQLEIYRSERWKSTQMRHYEIQRSRSKRKKNTLNRSTTPRGAIIRRRNYDSQCRYKKKKTVLESSRKKYIRFFSKMLTLTGLLSRYKDILKSLIYNSISTYINMYTEKTLHSQINKLNKNILRIAYLIKPIINQSCANKKHTKTHRKENQ